MQKALNYLKVNTKSTSLIAFSCKKSNSEVQFDHYCDFNTYEELLDKNLITNAIFDLDFEDNQSIRLNNDQNIDSFLFKVPNDISLIIMFINEKTNKNDIQIFKNFSKLNKLELVKFLIIETKEEAYIGVYLSFLVNIKSFNRQKLLLKNN
jgi:hypothetical protein